MGIEAADARLSTKSCLAICATEDGAVGDRPWIKWIKLDLRSCYEGAVEDLGIDGRHP